ncbi:TRAP transporter small permease [Treponema parvum]|uniref:TRAP transporter small permease n=1 Tax=Treponema parvum TaxID=138851 RepID=A0A975F1Y5_9SPIR|nr:TRAP transporter small permease [Treponema parvum]QTQ12994.1 TRAP transporter small permease [Treponema parvum]
MFSKIKTNKKTVLDVLDTLENIIGVSMFFMMIMFLVFNVCSWWFAKKRFGQLEEAVTACLVWISYINMGSHYRRKQHIRVDFLLTKFSLRNQKIADIINDIFTFIIGMVVFYFGSKLMLRSRNKYTGVLKICYLWIDLGLVIGFGNLLFNIIYRYLPHKKTKVVKILKEE